MCYEYQPSKSTVEVPPGWRPCRGTGVHDTAYIGARIGARTTPAARWLSTGVIKQKDKESSCTHARIRAASSWVKCMDQRACVTLGLRTFHESFAQPEHGRDRSPGLRIISGAIGRSPRFCGVPRYADVRRRGRCGRTTTWCTS